MRKLKNNSIISQFDRIDIHDYRGIVDFFIDRTSEISMLEDEEHFYLRYRFIKALFQLGHYEKVLIEIDPLIEYVFIENVNYEGDSFEYLVFLKAAACLNDHQYDKAIDISEQLVSMNPQRPLYRKLLSRAYYEKIKDRFAWLPLMLGGMLIAGFITGGIIYFKAEQVALASSHIFFMVYVLLGLCYGAYYLYSRFFADNKSLKYSIEKIKNHSFQSILKDQS